MKRSQHRPASHLASLLYQYRALLGLQVLALLVALPPLLLVPPTAKPDEFSHWGYAIHLATTKSLPHYASPGDAASGEAHQPPLYYGISALLSSRLGQLDAFSERTGNPFFLSTERGNRNTKVLGRDALRLFLVGRLVSLAFWILLPLLMYWAWGPVLSRASRLAVAVALALVPLLPFVGTSYSNDIASVTFLTVALGAVLRLLDPHATPRWRWSLLFGLALGLSLLTKIYALPFVAATACLVLVPLPLLDGRRRFQLLGGLILATAMLLSWMLSNWQRFGDPLGLAGFAQFMGYDPNWLRIEKITLVAARGWRTFWADLGPGGRDTISVPLAGLLVVIEAIAAAGAVRRWRQMLAAERPSSIALLCSLWIILALASFVATFLRTKVTVISGGRNLLYLHLVNLPLLLFGLRAWLPSGQVARTALVGLALALTAWSWGRLAHTYPLLRIERLPPAVSPPLARFGDAYALTAWQIRQRNGHAWLDFSLAKVGPDDDRRVFFIQVLAPDGSQIANLNTFPAFGVLSTAYWPPGTILHESYELPLRQSVPPGARVLFGLWSMTTQDRLPTRDAAGNYLPDAGYLAPWPTN